MCKSWRAKHRSEFSFPKYQLTHINQKRNIDYLAGLKLMGRHFVQKKTTTVN